MKDDQPKKYSDQELIQLVLDRNLMTGHAPIHISGKEFGTWIQMVSMEISLIDPKNVQVAIDKKANEKIVTTTLANIQVQFKIKGSENPSLKI